jgi:hypothetical protein
MPNWFEVTIGTIFGLGLVGGVFRFTFVRVPERRSDGGITNRDADYFIQNTVQESIEPPSGET